jgi:hypothetical protein
MEVNQGDMAMKPITKTVLEVLIQVNAVHVPNRRLRGLKPSAIRSAEMKGLIVEYKETGVILTPAGKAALQASTSPS